MEITGIIKKIYPLRLMLPESPFFQVWDESFP